MVIGLGIVAWVILRRLRASRPAALCAGLTLIVAAAVFLAYVANPIALL